MTRLSFHKDLYAGTSVDEAVKLFAPYASFKLSAEPTAWVVEVSAQDASHEPVIARELANHALGLTIRSRGGVR